MRELTIDEQLEMSNILADARKIRHTDPGDARIQIEAVRDFIQYFNSLGSIDFSDAATSIAIYGCILIAQDGAELLATEKLTDEEFAQLKALSDVNFKQLNEWKEQLRLNRPSRVYPSLNGERESFKASPKPSSDTPLYCAKKSSSSHPTFLIRLWASPLTKIALCLLMASAVTFGLTGVGVIIEAGAIVAATLLATSVGLFATSAALTVEKTSTPAISV